MSTANGKAFTFEIDVHLDRVGHGARQLLVPGPAPVVPVGRVPKVARWMALAIRCDELVRAGVVGSYRDLADLAGVTRARVTQIMNLLHLAPDIQEALLDLPRVTGREPVLLRDLQPIAQVLEWKRQRRMWKNLMANPCA
ncbi:MAG: hypothetical protein KF873_12105 [Gemmataceae bacterium]|nr:hypothetical protein [Gemmataceae bacterium]